MSSPKTELSDSKLPADVALFYLKIDPEDIVLLKFVLESYEGLGVLRTINPASGEVVFIALPDTASAVESLLSELSQTVRLRRLPLPPNADEDWVLGES